jgi:hypothetical protein
MKKKLQGRYRKVQVSMWTDENFRGLSSAPSGKALWFFLLTGPQTGPIPGLYRAGRAAMAEELDWPLDDFYDKFAELESRSMVQADFKARLVWLPNALKHNLPESPNVVKSWRAELAVLPDCDLKREALACIRLTLADMGDPFVEAFDEALSGVEKEAVAKPGAKPSAKPSAKPTGEDFPESGTGAGTGTGTGAGQPPCAPTSTMGATQHTAGELSTTMRRFGLNANPGHPLLVTLAAQGVTPATVQAACDEAKLRKRMNVGYVLGILERWKADADALRLTGVTVPPARASPARGGAAKEDSRKAAAASIGLGGDSGNDDSIIDIECRTVGD